MDISNQFINYVKFDEIKRIIISVNTKYQSYLQDEKYRQMLKKGAMDILKDDFEKLEIGKNLCRITVKQGTEEENLKKIKTELIKGLEFALRFMGL